MVNKFLIRADKNPNTRGATLLGLAGPEAPRAEQIVDAAISGNLDVLWVFGHDLVQFFGVEKVRQLSETMPLFLLTVYAKSDRSDISISERNAMRQIIDAKTLARKTAGDLSEAGAAIALMTEPVRHLSGP